MDVDGCNLKTDKRTVRDKLISLGYETISSFVETPATVTEVAVLMSTSLSGSRFALIVFKIYGLI